MTGQDARDDEREVRAIFEALADRLGEHPHSRNHEQGMSGEYETFIHETNVEALAEWLMPTVLEAVARKHPEPEITGSASQLVTDLLGTDDWVIVHRGHELVTDVDLDALEAAALRAPAEQGESA